MKTVFLRRLGGLVMALGGLAWLAWGGAAQADTLYKCTDERGLLLYTNQKNAAKKCVVLSREQPISTFSAPKGGGSGGKPGAAASPSDFPRVEGNEQRVRDNDRRAILQQELASEQRLLEEAKKQLAERAERLAQEDTARNPLRAGSAESKAAAAQGTGLQAFRDSVELHERNIDALQREIANAR